MIKQFMTACILGLAFFLTTGCSKESDVNSVRQLTKDEATLYANKGTEHKVYFKGLYRSRYTNIGDIKAKNLSSEIQKVTPFLFGPLTHRSIGGVQKGELISPLIGDAYMDGARVMIPYEYKGTWLIQHSGQNSLELPLPYSISDLENSNWKSCTEHDTEEHSTWSFLWYFWDPSRFGCSNRLGREYQNVIVEIQAETVQSKNTYPEYNNMIRMQNGVPTLEMTFAFGYVEDANDPNPFTDTDYGVQQFQTFYGQLRSQLIPKGFKEFPILQSEYTSGTTKIGALFTGTKNGVVLKIVVVAAAGVDQMDIFATSYAQKHHGFFGWFGHSRVGAGFDAQTLRNKLVYYPDKFSISSQYQLVYWAGCNSYSYYTLPFFEMKSALDPNNDPLGTRRLDIISNTLSSLFAFNAPNANIVFQALFNWEKPSSFQVIVDELENFASRWNYDVMVNVLGDEDNNQ